MSGKRDFIQRLTYDVNNGGTLELIQHGHDGDVMIVSNSGSDTDSIPNGDMVMLMKYSQ